MSTSENAWQGELSAIDLASIESLKTLKQEQDQLGERLTSMDGMKANFADAVYQRVRGDYRKRLTALDEQAAPLKLAAREQYARLRALLDRFEAEHEAIKLDQQELELRHQLGEFDDKEFGRRTKAIENTVKDRAEARTRGLELKARFLEAFHNESELDSVAATSAASAGATNRFSMADLQAAQSRTHEMPSIDDEASPGKTQAMSPINIPVAETTAAPAPAATGGGATQIFRAARLVPQNPEAGKQSYTLTLKPISIGADSSNDVRIGGPGVDPKHAKIVVSMGGFTIVDLGSKHGTRVNAEKVRERPLANEDVIQIGAARYVFREG